MPKPLKNPRKRPSDINQLARHLVEVTTDTVEPPSGLSAYMAAIGRQGGLKGGKRRLETMTKRERTSVATKAARARWKHKKTA
jgi:hypothetical protein